LGDAFLIIQIKILETVEKRPNVILILTDDQGWGDLGIHGNEKISTPTIDAMAGKGAHFERFFVSPLCAPTRASLLTGRYNLRTGTSWVSKGLENMRPEEVTIAEIFQNPGICDRMLWQVAQRGSFSATPQPAGI
jgi:arylsulfatase A-like enzyme